MTTFQIWYATPEFSRNGGAINARHLVATHVHLKDIERDGGLEQLEGIFRDMQGEVWSPNGEARPLIAAKKLSHTSMSIGDVVVVNGEAHAVASFGFQALGAVR